MEEMGADQADYMLPDQEDVRCYVGVGASAGGVEALQELFSICRLIPAHRLLLCSIFHRMPSA